MLETIHHLYDRVDRFTKILLFEAKLKNLRDEKKINNRQYAIMNGIHNHEKLLTLTQLKQMPWFIALYDKLSDKTKQRDIAKLKALNLVFIENKQLVPSYFKGN
ncbi:hypothetical protein NURINAE_00837 [Candidatus Nitrosacidococcus sp. I8]|nr:hypothetical protein NURINAE_00837 [Candidatus Nitrosacidococcus sp. I8]